MILSFPQIFFLLFFRCCNRENVSSFSTMKEIVASDCNEGVTTGPTKKIRMAASK